MVPFSSSPLMIGPAALRVRKLARRTHLKTSHMATFSYVCILPLAPRCFVYVFFVGRILPASPPPCFAKPTCGSKASLTYENIVLYTGKQPRKKRKGEGRESEGTKSDEHKRTRLQDTPPLATIVQKQIVTRSDDPWTFFSFSFAQVLTCL